MDAPPLLSFSFSPDGPTASTGMYEGFCSMSAVASERLRTPQPFCKSR